MKEGGIYPSLSHGLVRSGRGHYRITSNPREVLMALVCPFTCGQLALWYEGESFEAVARHFGIWHEEKRGEPFRRCAPPPRPPIPVW
jgi:hypothetical protein